MKNWMLLPHFETLVPLENKLLLKFAGKFEGLFERTPPLMKKFDINRKKNKGISA